MAKSIKLTKRGYNLCFTQRYFPAKSEQSKIELHFQENSFEKYQAYCYLIKFYQNCAHVISEKLQWTVSIC